MIFNIKDIKKTEQEIFYLEGWRSVVIVNFGYLLSSKEVFLLWNVDGTSHTFGIELKIVTKHHGAKFIDHFKKTLKKFREDLIDWSKTGKPEYMEKYNKEFGDMITYF